MYNKHNLKYKGSDVRFLTNIEFKKRMNLLDYQKLNNLFNIFYENFQGFKIYNLLQSLKDKKETDQTKIYWNLIEKRDEILEKMRQHSMQTELNNQSVESERKKL